MDKKRLEKIKKLIKLRDENLPKTPEDTKEIYYSELAELEPSEPEEILPYGPEEIPLTNTIARELKERIGPSLHPASEIHTGDSFNLPDSLGSTDAFDAPNSFNSADPAVIPVFYPDLIDSSLLENDVLISSLPVNRPARKRPDTRRTCLLTHASLLLTDSCNLSCSYCYRPVGVGHSLGKSLGLRAVDFLLAHAGKHISINFFGGEPLLVYQDMEEIITYAKTSAAESGKSVSFSVNTNGMLITREILTFLRRHRVGIVLSLDGPPLVHDLHRRTPTGNSCFHDTERIFPLLLEEPRQVHVRMTVTPDTVSHLYESIQYIQTTGFRSAAAGLDRTDDRWTQSMIAELALEYRKIIPWYLDLLRQAVPFHLVDLDFGTVSLDYPLKGEGIPCGAGLNGIAIGTDGHIYPCYRFAGMEGSELGDIFNGFNERVLDSFVTLSYKDNTRCRHCPLSFRCHRCPWLSYVKTGNYTMPIELNCMEGEVMLELFQDLHTILESEQLPEYLKRKSAITKQFGGQRPEV